MLGDTNDVMRIRQRQTCPNNNQPFGSRHRGASSFALSWVFTDSSTLYSVSWRRPSPSELNVGEIHDLLAQLNTYLGDGGINSYTDALSKEVLSVTELDPLETLLAEMDHLRGLRDRASDASVRIWEREGATATWENSRELMRPFQLALDAVDKLCNHILAFPSTTTHKDTPFA